jgi:hypothetical protein
MSIAAVLPLGFIIGMGHALETDHLTAVSNMLAEKGSRRALIARGAFWGLGHTLALFLICTAVVLLGLTISGTLQAGFEFAVGVMIVALGVQTLWRLNGDRVHIHDHGGAQHLHAQGDALPHTRARHAHPHRARNAKALGIGLIHGAAGSGALLVLTISATQTVAGALTYFAVFGIGAMAGMAALSAIASFPLMFAQRGATWFRTSTTLTIGCAALWIGGTVMVENGALLHPFNN